MLIPVTIITFTQIPSDKYPTRNNIMIMNFIEEGETDSTWANLTDTCKLKFPKNINILDANGNKINWTKQNIVATIGTEQIPVFMRGDEVKIEIGYIYKTSFNGKYQTETNIVFEGFITKINNAIPIELDCEDQMYQLKQILVPIKTYKGSQYSAETMIQDLLSLPGLAKYNYKVVTDNYNTQIGDFIIKSQSVAQVLQELREKYHLQSYFRKNTSGIWELRVGIIKYYNEDRTTPTTNPQTNYDYIFHFQKNITDDKNLVYTREDDIRIGIKAYSVLKVELKGLTKANTFRTQHKRLEVIAGDPDGEVRTLFFWNVQTVAELTKLANAKLKFLKYEGFRGSFTTFGLPFVRHGDIIRLENDIIPERMGNYYVKGVKTKFGINGIRQQITIDYRVDSLSTLELQQLTESGL